MGGRFSATRSKSHSYHRLNGTEDGTLKCFTLKDLKTATGTFIQDIQVSCDEICRVKGWIDEPGYGFAITVKKLNQVCCDREIHNEWLRIINNIGQLSHPNLVKIIGYCLEDIHPILVYEFWADGSLDNHLYKRPSNIPPLSWKCRMKIALDAAKALAYLHSDEVDVIHGDFKASNILIDSNHNAKLSDFGLDKYESNFRSPHDSALAPEYIMTGRKTKKGDAYSFGVVLLEIMSGKCAFDRKFDRKRPRYYLIEWAKPLLLNKCKIFKVMDCYIEGQYSRHEAMKVAHIAIQCLSQTPKDRPNMDEVMRALEASKF